MPTTLHARYVFPIDGDPIPDGIVCLEGERIVACGAGASPGNNTAGGTSAPQDLGNVAILPGLVNAHVHLDFSDVPSPSGYRGIRFVDWLRLVMEFRRQTPPNCQSTALGIAECLRGGMTAVGDIVQPNQPPAASPGEVTAFLELIAPTADRVAGAVQLAEAYLADACVPLLGTSSAKDNRQTGHCLYQAVAHNGKRLGLSPHAPYSVHPELLAAVVRLSQNHRVPVAMHLAESPEELELLRRAAGPLREFLEELGAWDAAAVQPGTRPLDYLRSLATAHRALVVHGNYLDDEEIAFLGKRAERMSVVYCPRSHDWFGHRIYPLQRMLAAGATVALGTDGRGSSPDLSLLNEMRFAAQRHPGVALRGILRMATINGARALGREADLGSLSPGKRADLAIVALPERSEADPHELLFDPAATVVACYCRGSETYRSGNAATS
jgi:aminodeoxyfutalosine deaminase